MQMGSEHKRQWGRWLPVLLGGIVLVAACSQSVPGDTAAVDNSQWASAAPVAAASQSHGAAASPESAGSAVLPAPAPVPDPAMATGLVVAGISALPAWDLEDQRAQAPAPTSALPAGASSSAVAAGAPVAAEEPCDPTRPALPLPGASDPGRQAYFAGFRAPLPAAPLWNPPGPKRVGLQVGHWQNEAVPPELGRLQHGAVGGGKQEWEVNLEVAERAKALLEAEGVEVDLLPAAVPPRYRAHAFVSIHADGDTAGVLRGYKIARPGFSSIPAVDDRLVEALYAAYGPATGLRRDDEHITVRMRYYYAFNSRRYCHAVAPGVPQAIVETGFLTSAADRRVLIGDPDAPARGIADGLLAFLATLPPR